MSCKLKKLISVVILLAIVLSYLSYRYFTAVSQREFIGYSEKSGFNKVNSAVHNFRDKTLSVLRGGVSEFNSINPNLKRSRRATKFDVSADSSKVNEMHLLSNVYALPSNSNDTNSRLRSFYRQWEREAGFQGDAPVPVFGGPVISGKLYTSQSQPSYESTDIALPMVHCSKDVMTLTAAGREHAHILVDRVDAAPLPLFQVPAYCGYSVRVTWKDLVLSAPYDGCFVTKEKGSYVLSLLWWGSPIKISCPVKRGISNPAPSVLCSQFGMVISIEGAQEALEKHQVKVNGNVLPLVSETCAYRIHSPAEVVLLLTPFNSGCVTLIDEENILFVILDGKQFTLSCPVPHRLSRFLHYLHSHQFHRQSHPSQQQIPFIPHVPAFPAVPASKDSSKAPVIPHLPYEQPAVPHFQPDHTHPLYPMHQIPSVYQHQKPPAHYYPIFPFHSPAPPVDTFPKPSMQQHLPMDGIPQMSQYPMMPHPHYSPYPISCPPYPEEFCSQYPILYPHPSYQELAMTTDSQPTIEPMPWTSSQPTDQPLSPFDLQEGQFFPPAPRRHPSKISPSLKCTRNRLMATLPTTRADSIKVKDMNTHTWMSIASAPLACNYNLRSRSGGFVLSSPLPSCHTKKLSSSVISLLVRYWDSSQRRSRTLQLQCHHHRDTDIQHLSHPLHTTAPPPARTPSKLQVFCSSQHMHVKLPPGPTSGLQVQAPSSGPKKEACQLLEAPSHCGYSVKTGTDGAINILLPYSSCHMTRQDGQYKIILKYQTPHRRTIESLLSCQASFSQECKVPHEQRLVCGSRRLSPSECHNRGCCYCRDTRLCFYPMDECTMDRHFIFSVHSSAADPPLSPSSLVTAGNSSCTPIKVTADLALFKIPLDECGVHRYEVGKTVIYMVEILNQLQPISLNYGTITRDSPVRLLVECRYLPGSVVSVGYLVKSPSLGPSIKAQGVFGVQLRIAKDEQYDDFYPQYHQPLRILLGKLLYLEVRLLNPPDPAAMLLVHYCVAYPRSAKSAWILIYDGCPNLLDKTPTHNPPAAPEEALTNHVRRFTVTTFQFLSEDTDLQADEEIYFMCSTEVCLPSDGPCVEGCFGDPSPE